LTNLYLGSEYPVEAANEKGNKSVKSAFLMLTGLVLLLPNPLTAQPFKVLQKFDTGGVNPYGITTNRDGANPTGRLILSGKMLYGTAIYGGAYGLGTLFAVDIDGTGFTNLYTFSCNNETNCTGHAPYGAIPVADLVLSDSVLYGVAAFGGNWGSGTLFKINTNGTDFLVLYNFAGGTNGANPFGDLVLSGSTLYGTTQYGGSWGSGNVYKINTDGTGFQNLYSFTALNDSTNNDGAHPRNGLVLSGNTLYGVTYEGGPRYAGTLFAINTDGTDFTLLHTFTTTNGGGGPWASLALAGDSLYGTASYGGISSGSGTLFKISTDGMDFRVLHDFSLAEGRSPVADLLFLAILLTPPTPSRSMQG
jgi:uncharacterized repeat protein (TIGR03803 family)